MTPLTRDQILALPAGREMDALVTERVMQWARPERCPCWSTDIAAAWEVVEKLAERGRYPTIHIGPTENHDEPYAHVDLVNPADISVVDETAPLAICRAALLSVLA